ncbi:MAG: hypothetical protein QOE61_3598 [Micromonosporaceae bacterium]|jgi:uncharacterized protein (DUF697 family)|nr:hypothetical protein [Micromonosporaceae bacterium]
MEDPSGPAGGSTSRRSSAKGTPAVEPRTATKKAAPAATVTHKSTTTAKASVEGKAKPNARGEAPAGGKPNADRKAKGGAPGPGNTARGGAAGKSTARPASADGSPKPAPRAARKASPPTGRKTTAAEPAPESLDTEALGAQALDIQALAPEDAAPRAAGPAADGYAEAPTELATGAAKPVPAAASRAVRTPEPPPIGAVLADAPEAPDTAHLDGALIAAANAGAVQVDFGLEEIAQLESVLSDLESVLRDVVLRDARPTRSTETHPVTPHHIPLWARVVADPGYAAEHVARAAVHRLGPVALDWVIRARTRYPAANPDALARLAAKESVRTARWQGAATGAAGVLGSMAATGLLAHVQARLVLTIAAAYGFDPTAHERARDLLNMLRAPRLTQPTPAAVRNAGRVVAGVAAGRVAARLLPLGAAVAGATIGARSTRDVAERATTHYRRQGSTGW